MKLFSGFSTRFLLKKILFLSIVLLFFVQNSKADCPTCTVTNPQLSGNYTFPANSVVCFTSNATFGDVTFSNNSTICISSGVTVIIQNNLTTTSGQNITFEVAGTLQFNQVPTINANLTANITSTGLLRAGTTETNNFTFNGTNNILNNNGTVQVSVLQFDNASSTNVVDNYGTFTIGSNINIKGNTTFRNWNLINIGSSYNNNSTSTYINCGTINSAKGFNLGGGLVINTGNFNVTTGQIDINGGTLKNYGVLYSGGTINGTSTSIIYNEGLAKITNFQPNTMAIKGPDSSSKKGYFYYSNANPINHNGSKVGPNLDFKKYTSFNPDVVSGTQGESSIFATVPNYVNASGTTTTAALANVTYACSSCTAPLVTNIGVCPNVNGSFPPKAVNDAATTNEDTPVSFSVVSNDTDVDGTINAATVDLDPATTGIQTTFTVIGQGTYTVNTSGLVTFTPVANYNGTATAVNYTVNDNSGATSNTATISVTVTAVNDAPVVAAIPKTGTEDTDITFTATDFTSKFTDVDGNPLSKIKVVDLPANGTLKLNGVAITAGQEILAADLAKITFTPAANWNGSTSFNWNGSDGTTYAVTNAPVNITVTAVNDAPIAINDVNTTFINTAVNGQVLTNDSDPEGSPLTVTPNSITDTDGSVTIKADGTYIFTPASGFEGEFTFTYEVCDNGTPKACDIATVTIEVMPLPVTGNDAPVAVNDAYQGTVNTPVTGDVKANDFDVDGDIITVITHADGKYDSNGDGTLDAQLTICTAPETCTGNNVWGINSSGDYVLAGVLKQYADGTFTFEPENGFTGQVTYTYVISDGNGGTDNAIVTIDITAQYANAVFGLNDAASTPINTPVSGNVLGNDYDPQGDIMTVTNPGTVTSASGELVIAANGTYTFTPATGFTGDYTYNYTVCDNGIPQACDEATVVITVYPAPTAGNDPPVALNNAYLTAMNTDVSGTVLPNDSDPDGDMLTVTAGTYDSNGDGTQDGTLTIGTIGSPATPVQIGGVNSANQPVANAGSLTQNADGTFTFEPAEGFTGQVTYTYTIFDGTAYDTATVTIDVTGGNTTFATDDVYMGNQNMHISGTLTTNDYDPQGDIQTINTIPVTGTVNGTLTINIDGTFTYIPNAGFSGTDQFVYEVCDNGTPVACDQATVYLNIIPVNLWKGTTGTDWNTPVNWVANRVPAPLEDVEFATEENNKTVSGVSSSGPAVNNLVVPVGETNYKKIGNLTNETNLATVIPAGASLTVAGQVYGSETNPAKIQVQAAKDLPNGTLILAGQPCNSTVMGTVQLYAKGFKDAETYWDDNIPGSPTIGTRFYGTYHWQHFGVPVEEVRADPTFYKSYLRKYHEDWNKKVDGTTPDITYYAKWENLVNGSMLKAFEGYEITQDVPTTYIIAGKMNYCDKTITLTRKAPEVTGSTDTNINNRYYGLGQNIFGNSYTASIDITKMNFEAEPQIEPTVYLYNTGRFTDWAINGDLNEAVNSGGLSAGQYTSIPKENAAAIYDGRIPSMNGFLLIHRGQTDTNGDRYTSATDPDVTMTLPYISELLPNTRPQTAPRKPLSYLRVGLASKSTRDNLWLFSQPGTTDKLDDGWDGRKFFGTPTAFIYTENADGPMQVSTNETIDGSVLSFYANSDTEYTLALMKTNLEDYTDLHLIDLIARTVTPLSSDTTRYHFTANNKGSTIKRFIIANSANINLNSDKFSLLHGYVKENSKLVISNFTSEEGIVNLFDISGKRFINTKMPVSVSEIPVTLEPGVYILDLQADGKHESIKLIIK